MITLADIAWTAGFMEGEAHFYKNGSPRIQVGQVDLEPLNKLVKLYGGNIRKNHKPTPGKKQVWAWSANVSKSVGIMLMIYSFMSERRKGEIENSIKRWRTKKLTRHLFPDTCVNGHYNLGSPKVRCKTCAKEYSAMYRKLHRKPVVS